MTTLLVCAPDAVDPQIDRFRTACDAAAVGMCVKTDRQSATPTEIAGILLTDVRSADIAAAAAVTHQVAWHTPEAVALCRDRLRLLGRLTAAGLPVPRYAAIDIDTGAGIERVVSQRFPCRVSRPPGDGSALVADLDALHDVTKAWAGQTSGVDDQHRVVVESVIDGPEWLLVGLLDAGALRVLSVIECPDPALDPGAATLLISPASLTRDATAHLAGIVARACMVLGLRDGPVKAACRGVDTSIALVDVAPASLDGARASVLPLLSPDHTPCRLEDVLVRHALRRPLDGYAHDGTFTGIRLAAGGQRDGAPQISQGASVGEVRRLLRRQSLAGT